MKDSQTVYIAIDLHRNSSTIGHMNHLGEYCGHRRVETTSVNLINQVVAIPRAGEEADPGAKQHGFLGQ